MPELTFVTDLFEMIAALAALGVTFILYLETRRMRDEMRHDRKEMMVMRDEVLAWKLSNKK
ncbi:MAG: hypothetical protein ABJM82_15870 [Shimia thalassica]|uniref:hypothetical protein n=1 Tax=Shimia thalassica TaxID=1715693 RepID=UPI003298723C